MRASLIPLERVVAELSRDVIDEILGLVERREDALLRNLFPSLHPADLADLLDILDADDRSYLFDLIPEEIAPDVLVELEERPRAQLVEDMEESTLTELIRPLDSDDAADLLGELDDPVRETVLERLEPDDAEDIRTLLEFDPDTAGGLMAAEYVALGADDTVAGAVRAIREVGDAIPDLRMVYVVESGKRFRGVAPLRALLTAGPDTALRDVARPPRVVVAPELDQEAVATRFRQYDAIEAPVVDEASGRMLGVITIDDIVDVIQEEADEDLGRIAGTGDESVTDSVLLATGRRLPWLLVGLAGGLLAAWALSRYELSLKQIVSLAFFVPVINAMGGNVAMQSSSIAVRSIALGSAYRAMGNRMWKEFLVSILNGLACGVLIAVVVGVWLGDVRLAALVGGALFCVILISTTVGALVPVMLHRMKVDPALAAGPFVTTANDVLGILVYLSLADLLLVRA